MKTKRTKAFTRRRFAAPSFFLAGPFLFFLILILFSATGSTADIPSSIRSRNAIKRVTPTLKQALREKGLSPGSPIFIRIFKEEGDLEMWVRDTRAFKLFKTYRICYFSGSLGPKTRQGDLQSPEGFYFVKPSQLNPYSRFHLSFNIGYPNAYEKARGWTGGSLMVHGDCVSIGCYAMTDSGIDEIYALADAAFRNGQPFFRVHIFPFRMTRENMGLHSDSKWYGFWKNLKEGYDLFERKKRPLDVTVKNGRYHFRQL